MRFGKSGGGDSVIKGQFKAAARSVGETRLYRARLPRDYIAAVCQTMFRT